MRRIAAILLLMIFLTGCSGAVPAVETCMDVDATDLKIAFVTDSGDIHDQGFNQYSYAGVERFCQESGAFCKYFQPPEETRESLQETLSQAIKENYDVIVMAGPMFAKSCLNAAYENPDTLFLVLAVTPADMSAGMIPQNMALINHQEEQAGFLAGYAAVADGYKNLGFLGGVDVAAVVRFGHGYLQGADRAAAFLNIDDVNVKYWYSGTFNPNQEIEEKMSTWYQEGTEVVFACGGAIYESALAAAEKHDGLLIGVDVDQSHLSPRVITSATKSLENSVVMALNAAVKNHMKWPDAYAGANQVVGVNEDCVGLPMETSRFRSFTPEMYDVIYKAIVNSSVTVDNNGDPHWHPKTPHITVDWQ